MSAARALLLCCLLALAACASPAAGPADPGRKVTAREVSGWVSFDDTLREATGQVTWLVPLTEELCRIWVEVPANTATVSANGTRGWVDGIEVDGQQVEHRMVRVAGDRGSRAVTEDLDECAGPGHVSIGVRFRVHAGAGGNERIGATGRVSWWGSLLPRPAHLDRDGAVVDPVPVAHKGEPDVNEVARVTDLEVAAPAWARLIGPGLVAGRGETGGRRLWQVTSEPVRDVALVVGAMDAVTVGSDGCRVQAVVPAGAAEGPGRYADAGADALLALKDRFAFCPYALHTIAAVQPGYGGMEFPGVMVVARHDPVSQPRLIAHEIAHQYFYALIGNDQGRHPWLDEAFATYAEALVNPATAASLRHRTYPAGVRGRMAEPMSWWNSHAGHYSTGVYAQGASTLLEARDAAGAERFDDAVQDWLAVCSHRVCGPGDLRRVLEKAAPAAAEVLARAGAWR